MSDKDAETMTAVYDRAGSDAKASHPKPRTQNSKLRTTGVGAFWSGEPTPSLRHETTEPGTLPNGLFVRGIVVSNRAEAIRRKDGTVIVQHEMNAAAWRFKR